MMTFDPTQGPGQDPQGPPEQQPRYLFRMVSGDQHTEVEGTEMVCQGRQIAVYDGDDCVGLAAGNCAVVRQAIPRRDGG